MVRRRLSNRFIVRVIDKSITEHRSIDHRSIDHIIFRNVKYVLKKGAKAAEEEEYKKDAPKWNSSSLSVGNWFSGTRYFEAVSASGDEVTCKSQG